MQKNESTVVQNNEKEKKFCTDWFELYLICMAVATTVTQRHCVAEQP